MTYDKPIPAVHIATQKLPSGEYEATTRLNDTIVKAQAWDEREAIRNVQVKVVEQTVGKR